MQWVWKKLKKKKHLRKQSGVSCIRWGPHVATKRVRQLGGGMGGATDLVTLDISNLLDLASDRSLTRWSTTVHSVVSFCILYFLCCLCYVASATSLAASPAVSRAAPNTGCFYNCPPPPKSSKYEREAFLKSVTNQPTANSGGRPVRFYQKSRYVSKCQ